MEMIKLNDICDVRDGTHDSPQYVTEGYPLVTSKNIIDGQIDITNVSYISEEDYEAINKRSNVDHGDILMPMIGTIGKPVIVNKEFEFAIKNVALIKFYEDSKVMPAYIRYVLDSNLFNKYVEKENRGGTQKFISLGNIRNFPVPVVSLEKQNETISILNKLSQMIKSRKLQWELLDNLVKSRFVQMFGDPVTNPNGYLVQTLHQLIEANYITYHLDGNHGGDYPKSDEFVDSGIPYIGANCIVNGEINFSMAKFLTKERAGKLRKGIAQNGDVLFAHNATVGPTVILHTTESKVILSTSLTAYRCNQEKITPDYLKAYMQSDGFIRQYSGEMKQTTRNQVPITAQKKYLFVIPPIAEQMQFANIVHQVDKLKVVVQKSLNETQLLFDSLMQKYFE